MARSRKASGRDRAGSTDETQSNDAKQRVRDRVWGLLEREGAARFPGATGRIPNFVGAERAAEQLTTTAEWQRARVVKANPDAPQLPVRARALVEGKLLVMPVPRLTDERPFVIVDPDSLRLTPRRAAAIRAVLEHGRSVRIDELPRVDLIVCGSVAVNRAGARVGKGGGFSDLEFALLVEAGLVDEATTIATTVHPLQLVEGPLPETRHDFRVDAIVTPDAVIRCPGATRPEGILWDDLDDAKRAAVPVLAALRAQTGRR